MDDGDFTGTATPPPEHFENASRLKELGGLRSIAHQLGHEDGRGWAYSVTDLAFHNARRVHTENQTPFGARWLEEFAQGRERERHWRPGDLPGRSAPVWETWPDPVSALTPAPPPA